MIKGRRELKTEVESISHQSDEEWSEQYISSKLAVFEMPFTFIYMQQRKE